MSEVDVIWLHDKDRLHEIAGQRRYGQWSSSNPAVARRSMEGLKPPNGHLRSEVQRWEFQGLERLAKGTGSANRNGR